MIAMYLIAFLHFCLVTIETLKERLEELTRLMLNNPALSGQNPKKRGFQYFGARGKKAERDAKRFRVFNYAPARG